LLKTQFYLVLTRLLHPSEEPFQALGRSSGAPLPEPCRMSLCYQPGQPGQVVRGATEDEQPVHFVQSAQLHLADRAGLLEPSEALLDQPATAQADGIAGVPGGSPVEVRAAFLVVLGHMHGDIQLARGIRVGGRFVRVVGALPAVEVRAVATLILRAVLRAEALVRGPRLDEWRGLAGSEKIRTF
jgi:hypothetical protein